MPKDRACIVSEVLDGLELKVSLRSVTSNLLTNH